MSLMEMDARPLTGRQMIAHIRHRVDELRATDPQLAESWLTIRDALLDAAAADAIDLSLPVAVEQDLVTGFTSWVNYTEEDC